MADCADTLTLNRPAIAHDSAVLRLGFLPLTDAAPLIVAQSLGLFRRHGVRVTLTPLNAWVALRDRIAIGRLDGGQMLAPMPIAAGLGLGGLPTSISVVSVLSCQGNTITFSRAMMAELARSAPSAAGHLMPATALAALIAARRAARPGAWARPALAVVFPYSSHNYLLRHWLASAGIDPDRDVAIQAVPPALVADELAEGRIDGFCAGQPWGSRAVDLRCGEIALTTGDIWPHHPEKLFAVSAAHLARNPHQVAAAVAALIEAGIWLAQPQNLNEAARLLHAHALADVPLAVVAHSLAARMAWAPDGTRGPGASIPFEPASSYPHPGHGAWFLAQMQRWQHAGQAPPDLIDTIWRPDIWALGAVRAGIAPAAPAMPPCPGAAPQ